LEGVSTLLDYVTYKKFKVYQMDVKSTFFNEILEEEVYIEHRALNLKEEHVYKLNKFLYGLK
jgi:hypothetical protein